jgi:hypothetical protein
LINVVAANKENIKPAKELHAKGVRIRTNEVKAMRF